MKNMNFINWLVSENLMTNLQKMSNKTRNRNLNKRDLIYEHYRRYFIDKQYATLWLDSGLYPSHSNFSLSIEH